MYDDPKDIRDREIKVRVTDQTYALIQALARDSGKQVAALAHELVFDGIRQLLAEHHAARRGPAEGPKQALKNVTGAKHAGSVDRFAHGIRDAVSARGR